MISRLSHPRERRTMFSMGYSRRVCWRWVAAALLIALLGARAYAAENGLFASNEPLVLRLEAPFAALKGTKAKPEDMDGKLRLQEGGRSEERRVGKECR